jgi:hypothetical protein
VSSFHPSAWVTATASAVLLASILMFLMGGYVGIMRKRTGASVPEANWRIWTRLYWPASIRQYLAGAGEGGWHAYRLALWWDVVFSAMFGLSGLVLVDGLWGLTIGVGRSWVLLFELALVVTAAVDIAEDLLLLYAVGSSPVPADRELPHPGVVGMAVWVTRAKFIFYATALVTLAAGAVTLVARGWA